MNEAQIENLYALLKCFISSTCDDDDFEYWVFVIDDNFADHYKPIQSYVGAFNIIEVEIVDNTKRKYNPVDAPLKDGLKIIINNEYIHSELNLEKGTFINAMKQNRQRVNEC